MVDFILISEDEYTVTFEYYPEGKLRPGTVTINKKDGEIVEIKASPDDFGNYYAYHVVYADIRDADGSFVKKGMAAWY